MLHIILMLIGLFIIFISFIFYSLFVGYARGMNVTGCGNHCSIRWSDFTNNDSWFFYLPAMFGLIILILGVYIYYRRKKAALFTDHKENKND